MTTGTPGWIASSSKSASAGSFHELRSHRWHVWGTVSGREPASVTSSDNPVSGPPLCQRVCKPEPRGGGELARTRAAARRWLLSRIIQVGAIVSQLSKGGNLRSTLPLERSCACEGTWASSSRSVCQQVFVAPGTFQMRFCLRYLPQTSRRCTAYPQPKLGTSIWVVPSSSARSGLTASSDKHCWETTC